MVFINSIQQISGRALSLFNALFTFFDHIKKYGSQAGVRSCYKQPVISIVYSKSILSGCNRQPVIPYVFLAGNIAIMKQSISIRNPADDD
ncbi:hypothetical protein A8C56_21755 [Niabella ginsenosidivorans]|uniref:Uncharacterized protein n=1 Tax=Niabella ginsenosidivorans TaxID=1176587 RepID=A0A1A9I7E4_9BACT|nr:hypothetical protein A8C56_21755 [Niabella ginsenosidivorans]